MDVVYPAGMPTERAAAQDRPSARAEASAPFDPKLGLTAVSGGARYSVLRLGASEMIVDASGNAPMRGVVDLFAGGERVGRLLVQFMWQRDGRAAYELKRRTLRALKAAVPHGARRALASTTTASGRAAEAP
ncbi:MAG: hypothetical protein AAF677_03745 [Pseudomonadota bacterium]